jgi:hypothetical protein
MASPSGSFGRSKSHCCGCGRSRRSRSSGSLLAFKERYNREWLCERHGYQPPAAVRVRGVSTYGLAWVDHGALCARARAAL